jgi:hypothetical protein
MTWRGLIITIGACAMLAATIAMAVLIWSRGFI